MRCGGALWRSRRPRREGKGAGERWRRNTLCYSAVRHGLRGAAPELPCVAPAPRSKLPIRRTHNLLRPARLARLQLFRETTVACRVLLVVPQFTHQSFWNFRVACELYGARYPAPPLGLITVAALLPSTWECRLIDRNTEALRDSDLDWADLVMTGGMLPQQADALRVIELAHARRKPVAVGGPDVTSSPDAYESADLRVLGEAEGIIGAFIDTWNSGLRQGVFEAEKFTADVTRSPVP